jgi:hypothetical protein
MALLIRLLVHPTEAERPHALEIRLTDSDGGELVKLEGSFTAGTGGQPGREMPINISLAMANTRFERAGDYSIELLVDNQHVKSLPLRLYEVPKTI